MIGDRVLWPKLALESERARVVLHLFTGSLAGIKAI
jgi:hypothetical protein